MAGATINATLIDGVLIIADHPLPAEYADELIVVEATAAELEQLEAAGYGWRWAKQQHAH
jgi:hypothetical protein